MDGASHMIVGRGSKVRKKPTKRKGISAAERAKAILKKAVLDGTLKELLWREIPEEDHQVPESDGEYDYPIVYDDEGSEDEGEALNPEQSIEPERPDEHEGTVGTAEWNRLLNRGTLMMPRKPTVVGKGPSRPLAQRSTFVTSDLSITSDRAEGGEETTVEIRPPRMRIYTQIMQKLKYAAQDARIASAGESEESESELDEEPAEEEEPAIQRDEDEILWAGVMGLPLDHESTMLSGYAYEATVVELFNLSNELRDERERNMREEKRRASRLLKSQGTEGGAAQLQTGSHLPHEIELQTKLEEKYLAGRRALLRLHCNTAQHELPSSGPTHQAFAQFWASALEVNAQHAPEGLYDRFASMKAQTVELPSHLHAVPEPEPDPKPELELEHEGDALDTVTEETVTRPLTEDDDGDGGAPHSRRESFPTEEFRNGLGELVPRSPPEQADDHGLEDGLIARMDSVTLNDAKTADGQSGNDEHSEVGNDSYEGFDSDGSGRRSEGEAEQTASADSDVIAGSDCEVAPDQSAGSPRRKRRERRQTNVPKKGRRKHRGTKVRVSTKEDSGADGSQPQPSHRKTVVDSLNRPNPSKIIGIRKAARYGRSDQESSDSDGAGNRHRHVTRRQPQRNPSAEHDDSPQRSPGSTLPERSFSRDLAELSTASLGSEASVPSPAAPLTKVFRKQSELLGYGATPYSTQGIGSVRAVRRLSAQHPAGTATSEVPYAEPVPVPVLNPVPGSSGGHTQQQTLVTYVDQAYAQVYAEEIPVSAKQQPAATDHSLSPFGGSKKFVTHTTTSSKGSEKYPSPPPRSAPTASTSVSANRPRVQSFEHEQPTHESPLRRLLSPTHRALPVPKLTFGYEHLTGIWPYDPSLDACRLLYSRVKQRQEGWASEGARQARKGKRTFRTLQTQRSRFSEVSFDPFAMLLVIRTYLEGAVTQRSTVPLQSVYLTESAVPDMLTLRTHDTRSVPSGYLGTYSISQWNSIVREINAALAQAALLTPEARRAVQYHLSQLSQGGSAALTGTSAATDSGTEDWEAYVNNDLSSRAVVFSDDVDTIPVPDARPIELGGGPSSPVFLTETNMDGAEDEYIRGGGLDTDIEDPHEPPHTAQVSASELQHLAEQGYAAYQELNDLYPVALQVPMPFSPQLAPRPPRGLNIPLIQATDGPHYTVVMGAHDCSAAESGQKSSARRRRKSRRDKAPKSDLDVHPINASSRFMDLIRGAVDMYKTECEALRRLREPAIVHTVEDTGQEEDTTLVTLCAEERRKLRYYDPHSLNRPGDVGYIASGFASHGESVQLSITGMDPFAPTRSMVLSPSPPRQPRRSSQRLRSFSEHLAPSTASAKERALDGMTTSEYQERPIELTAPTTPIDSARPPEAIRGLRFSIHQRESSPKGPAGDNRDDQGLKIVLLLESREKLQVYFAKKFLLLDFVVDVFTNTGDVVSALRGHGELYRAVLLNYPDVLTGTGTGQAAKGGEEPGDAAARCAEAVRRILHGTTDSRRRFLVVLYNVPAGVERLFGPDQLGVDAILSEPYSVAQLRAFI